MKWFYLIAASIFEIGWIFSLKKLSFIELRRLSFQLLAQTPTEAFRITLPFLGYVFFGLANVYFFSLAMKQIQASTAFAIWMGVTLASVKLVEVLFLKESSKPMDYVYLVMIAIAIIGLKKT